MNDFGADCLTVRPEFSTAIPVKTTENPMIFRILAAACVSAFAFLSVSCCCTGEPAAPPLRDMPQFQEMPAAAPVEYTK